MYYNININNYYIIMIPWVEKIVLEEIRQKKQLEKI